MADTLNVPVAHAVNHLLRGADWAREKLRPHAGKTARFHCAPFSVALTVLENGEVIDANAGIESNAEFILNAGIALRTLVGHTDAWQEVKMNGDIGFASAIAYVAQNLRWDVEADLSRLFGNNSVGDIAAHRIVEAGIVAKDTLRGTGEHFEKSLDAFEAENPEAAAQIQRARKFAKENIERAGKIATAASKVAADLIVRAQQQRRS